MHLTLKARMVARTFPKTRALARLQEGAKSCWEDIIKDQEGSRKCQEGVGKYPTSFWKVLTSYRKVLGNVRNVLGSVGKI